jgi:uncharacterized protein (TIGR02996 family)
MSDEQALLAAIYAHPLDDAPRLVYADWLDEHGGKANAARAEFIRVQCELELLPGDDPRYPILEKRQEQLLKRWRKAWLKPFEKERDVKFSRGFPVPTIPRVSAAHPEGPTEFQLRSAPLWRSYGVVTDDDELDVALRWPLLHRLTTFSLRSGFRAGWTKRLASCDGLRNVTELTFTHCALTAGGLKRILDAWTGRRLAQLWVNECPVGDAGIRLIAKHPATANLRLLYAHSAELTDRGMKAVADGPNLDRLREATFGHNPIGDAGGEHLLRWKALPGIRELFLMNTGLSKSLKIKFRKRLGTRVDLSK